MELYRKYRPQTLDEIIGNTHTINVLRKRLEDPTRIPHAILFHGPTGCGKTTLARIVANSLAVGSDFREVDSADFRGIDTIRDIRRQSQFMSLEGKARVWLLDECHKLSNDAQNALLKGLEDPPDHVYYILATTDPQKLIATIRGRCAQYEVKPLSDTDMMSLLHGIAKAEGAPLMRKIYNQIILDSQGRPRDAIQILEQVLVAPEEDRFAVAVRQAELQSQTIELCRALIKGEGWEKVSVILSGLKEQEPETVRRSVLGYCQAVLLGDDNVRAGIIMDEFMEPFYNTGFPGLVFACYSVVRGDA